ncbi:glycosyltransferase [Patescibacteria group bacterium]|nr:glycosyltransferase [Patescibacteria group bacterium]
MKTEQDITKNWGGLITEPMVSIGCLTYNHEAYIKEAINSFLMQETNFPFEIIIYDDGSTDANRQIISDYAAQYPNIIKTIFPEQNQYQFHKRVNIDFVYTHARGKYIAICEGDDYWIDSLKLQKQFEVLEDNPEIDLCLHPAYLLDAISQKRVGKIGDYPVDLNNPIIMFEAVVNKPNGQLATASSFFRATKVPLLKAFFDESQASIFDIFLHMLTAYKKGAYLLPDTMSVYRVNVPGSWNNNKAKFGLDNHVFKRAEAFGYLQRFVDEADNSLLQKTVFNSYLFVLKGAFASRKTKLKILNEIGNQLTPTQKIKFRLFAEFNLLHRAIVKFNEL